MANKTCECGRTATYFNSPVNGKPLSRGFCDSCYEDKCRRQSNLRLDRIQKRKSDTQFNKEQGDYDDSW
jgi:hypothetical protein